MKKPELTNSEYSDLFNKLALLLDSGVSLADGLLILSDEEKNKTYSDFLKELSEMMEEGISFSSALSSTGCFPKHITGLIAVSEQVGRTEDTLYSLSRYYDNKERLNRSIKNALTYPSILLLVMFVVIVVLLTKVLPIFEEVYSSLGGSLTGIAGGLLELGYILNAFLPTLGIILGAIVVAICMILLIPPVSDLARRTFNKLFGDVGIMKKLNNSRFADALSIALSSGIPLEQCVESAGELLCDNEGAYKRVRKCLALIDEGTPLDKALLEAKLLSASSCHLLAIAIRTGNADKVMEQIASRMSDEAQQSLESTVSKIEPALVVITSFIVGIILLSVMLPLINIMKAI